MAADGKVNTVDKFLLKHQEVARKEVKIPIISSAYHHPYFKLKNN
jgi:hypothetical protein